MQLRGTTAFIIRRLILVPVLLSGCFGLLNPSSTQQNRRSPFSSEMTEAPPILASAPQGMSLQDLGRPFTSGFQRLRGPDGASLFPSAQTPTPTPQNLMKHETVVIENEQAFAAYASAWGITGNVEQAKANRYASYRAMFIQSVYEIDDTTSMRKVAKNAVYYPARIYMGHVYEVVVTGREDSFTAGVAANFMVASGRIESFATQNNLKLQAMGRGIVPSTGQALFARSAEAIESSYELKGESAVPILVEWRVIPGRSAPTKKITWQQVKEGCDGEPGCLPCRHWEFYQVSYTAPGSKQNGNSWDGDGSAPDVVISINAGGSVRTTSKAQDEWAPAWRLSQPIKVDADDFVSLSIIDVDLFENDFIDEPSVQIPETIPDGVLTFGAGSVSFFGQCQSNTGF